MRKAILTIALLVLVAAVPVVALAGDSISGQTQAADAKAGAVLLDKLTATFKHLAESGSGNRAALEQTMGGLITEARQARAQKQLDAVFYFKFNRLMSVIQMAVVEDPNDLLNPIFYREDGDFIEEVTGEKAALPSHKGGGVGLAAIADALANEILNLRLYLETLPRREALRQEFYK